MQLRSLTLAVLVVVSVAACNKPAADAPAAPAASTVAPPAAPATVAAAQTQGDIDTFDLTMDNVDRMLKAQVAIGAAAKADPTLDPAMNISEENDAQYVARLEATPALKHAIESAGMSVHDYAYTAQSLVGTMMAVGAVEAGQLKEIPEGVNPRNAEFIKAHGAEIQKKMEALGASQQ